MSFKMRIHGLLEVPISRRILPMPSRLSARQFIDTLRDPHRLEAMQAATLEQVVRYARRARLFANLAERAHAAGVEVAELSDLFEGAQLYAAEHSRRIDWEMRQLAPLMATLDCPVVVLKGGAYLAMDLPSARGRLVSDLDLMVPHEHIAAVEKAMLGRGYRLLKQDEYDQQYYREWMHEIPPMAHVARGTHVDLHHNIAPPVSRLKIDAARLFERALPLADGMPFMRLGDEDLVLHLCVHMFHDGELENSLRELCDLDAMLRRFAGDHAYWDRLLARARELGVLRPLYYGVHFATRLLHTPVADELVRQLQIAAPLQPLRWAVEAAMQRAILPDEGERPSAWRGIAGQLLFLRAHWLRMPPMMLARHLLTQVRRRGGLKTAEQAAKGEQGV